MCVCVCVCFNTGECVYGTVFVRVRVGWGHVGLVHIGLCQCREVNKGFGVMCVIRA